MSIRAINLPVSEKELLTKEEAMAYSGRRSEALFDREILPYVKRKKCGNQMLYPKRRVYEVMMHPMYDEERTVLRLPKKE